MNYVGLFEGISGFGLAFKRAGANILAVCEIDKTCQSVLRRHHPEAEILSDVKTIKSDTFAGRTIDVLAGGFPCQDLSVAGQRKGLAGERSGLWFEFIRIIGDHKPRWVVIENVPGLLSSNGGRDFAIILRGLAECGYFVAYRVLNSQFDGVAQRRNRVFLVASLGTASCVEILFERESSQWDSPPSRETGARIAPTLESGINRTGGTRPPGSTVDTAETLIPCVIAGQLSVRRLTPTECERLQGFPNGWTAFGHDDKPISDSARYRMLGNAVCVPTAEWIAKRVLRQEAA